MIQNPPPYRGTRIHAVRVPDDVWQASGDATAERGESRAAVVVAALAAYVAAPDAVMRYLARTARRAES